MIQLSGLPLRPQRLSGERLFTMTLPQPQRVAVRRYHRKTLQINGKLVQSYVPTRQKGETLTDKLDVIESMFGVRRALIGVVHVQALPGTPASKLDIVAIAAIAVEEARAYEAAGFHAVMIENTHDRPYLKIGVGPEITAAMAVVGAEIRRAVTLPLGVQILAGANTSALGVALACSASFVRVEGFVFAHVADEGLIEASAGALLRYGRAIGADHVRVFADVKKKHSAHAITADVDIVETAKAAEFFVVDAVIVSGVATGQPADADEVNSVGRAVSVPTLVGSGITPENIRLYPNADAFIVGSSIKKDGLWSNPIDMDRSRALVRSFLDLPAN
jgi:membrane complex biogenesis BtpA family protein